VNGFFWRLVVSDFLSSSLIEIHEQWSYADALDAHDMLDAIETKMAQKP
jgi:hypothetical protein